jgi:hypothetical protein
MNPTRQVIRHAKVERAVAAARKHVDVVGHA